MNQVAVMDSPNKPWDAQADHGFSDDVPTALAGVLSESDWVARAACTPENGDTFFAEARSDVATALSTCASCAVEAECLAFALANDERCGIWGGTTPEQRRLLSRPCADQVDDEVHSDDTPPAA